MEYGPPDPPILPLRPKPFADESICSWISRVAGCNGLTLSRFWDLLFPQAREFKRDLDLLWAGLDVLHRLSALSGVPVRDLMSCQLNYLDLRLRGPGLEPDVSFGWFLDLPPPKLVASGLQFCPKCYQESPVYFRKHWRLTLITCCLQHRCLLHDECHKCGLPYMCYPGGINGSSGDLANCNRCSASLAGTDATPVADALVRLTEDCLSLLASLGPTVAVPFLQNARTFLRAMRRRGLRNVREFICSQAGVQEPEDQRWEMQNHFQFHRLRTRERAMELELLAWLVYGFPDSLDVVARNCNEWELDRWNVAVWHSWRGLA
jgi:hypothetical protein